MQNSYSQDYDCIVIGAGVLGTFHAYFAAQKGYKTLLIERNHFPDAASTRNFGMVVQTIVEVGGAWAAYARASREIYLTLQQEQDISIQHSGSLYIASTPAEDAVLREFAQLHASTYHCIYLNAEEVRTRQLSINSAYCVGGLFFPDDLTLDPGSLLRQLIPHMVRQGWITYAPQTTVVAVEPEGQSYLVRDARGNIYTTNTVILCAGTEYRTLYPEHFLQSGLQICKLQMMRTVAQPQVQLKHALLSGLSLRRYPAFRSCSSYDALATEQVDGELVDHGIHLLFKQAADGTIIVGDSHEYRTLLADYTGEETTDPAINAAILRYAQRVLDLPSWDLQRLWNGYYMLHPEREIYTANIASGLHIVTGIGGKGMSTGPGFARQHIESLFATSHL